MALCPGCSRPLSAGASICRECAAKSAEPSIPAQRRPRPSARGALLIAIAADLIQFGLLPLFAGGALSALNVALDLVVAALLIRRLGWHLALLPAFAAELIPGLDLVPSWTLAVWFVMRTRARDVVDR